MADDAGFDRLRYSVGPNRPGLPPRTRVLTVDADGTLDLELRDPEPNRRWRARLADTTVLDRIRLALDDAGFPDGPAPGRVVPGASWRVVRVWKDGAERTAQVEHARAERLAGYDELFRVLDSLIGQIGGDAVALGPMYLSPAVADVVDVGGREPAS